MKRFKSIAGLAAGLLLAGTMLGQTALAQGLGDSVDTGNTTSVTVSIAATGSFDAYFCQALGTASPGIDLSLSQAPTLASPGLATGSLFICYTDTQAYRPGFRTQITAGAFGGPSSIPLSGFKIDRSYNVVQHFWGSPASSPPQAADYGDIGTYVNNVDPNGQPATGSPATWTSSNTLDTTRTVQYGWEGVGTDWSYGQFDVSVVIPIGTQGGEYSSSITLSIIPGTTP
jgi:hypothetical protein